METGNGDNYVDLIDMLMQDNHINEETNHGN